MKIKLDFEQRQKAEEMIEQASDDEDILREFIYELVEQNEKIEKLKAELERAHQSANERSVREKALYDECVRLKAELEQAAERQREIARQARSYIAVENESLSEGECTSCHQLISRSGNEPEICIDCFLAILAQAEVKK